jgi:hypothetical protein
MIPCDKCGAGQPGGNYNAVERMAALECIAVVEDGPAFLKRCRYCGTLWEEDLRSIWIVTAAKAKAQPPSAPI